ncbi:hypothetical protein DEO72_LG3g1248 [Vigna unguiculata]|uniref:Uncharacterized protein n=1 Tax=Vigna unguiculata TaxID=3917 RepID=A0A4D6LDP0_VIGUN|nr:hypothetical protein DEO72_LG3g1248 [Vigna unguiculata]
MSTPNFVRSRHTKRSHLKSQDIVAANLQATTRRTHAGTLATPSHNSKNAHITLHLDPQLQEYSSI